MSHNALILVIIWILYCLEAIQCVFMCMCMLDDDETQTLVRYYLPVHSPKLCSSYVVFSSKAYEARALCPDTGRYDRESPAR